MTPEKVLGRQIEHWLHCNFMALTDSQLEATCNAWRSCQNADRPDNSSEVCQRLHRRSLQQMHDALAAAP